MRKYEKYLGNKTYMYPNGTMATPEIMIVKYPAVAYFSHIIETDEAGEVCFAVQNLSVMRHFYGIDNSLSEDEAIVQMEVLLNTPPVIPEPSPEERIASAMEFQNLMAL